LSNAQLHKVRTSITLCGTGESEGCFKGWLNQSVLSEKKGRVAREKVSRESLAATQCWTRGSGVVLGQQSRKGKPPPRRGGPPGDLVKRKEEHAVTTSVIFQKKKPSCTISCPEHTGEKRERSTSRQEPHPPPSLIFEEKKRAKDASRKKKKVASLPITGLFRDHRTHPLKEGDVPGRRSSGAGTWSNTR